MKTFLIAFCVIAFFASGWAAEKNPSPAAIQLDEQLTAVALAYFNPKNMISERSEKYIIYVDSGGFNLNAVEQKIPDISHHFIFKFGRGYEKKNGRTVEKETGVPCATLKINVVSKDSNEAVVRLTWIETAASIYKFRLEYKNQNWQVAEVISVSSS